MWIHEGEGLYPWGDISTLCWIPWYIPCMQGYISSEFFTVYDHILHVLLVWSYSPCFVCMNIFSMFCMYDNLYFVLCLSLPWFLEGFIRILNKKIFVMVFISVQDDKRILESCSHRSILREYYWPTLFHVPRNIWVCLISSLLLIFVWKLCLWPTFLVLHLLPNDYILRVRLFLLNFLGMTWRSVSWFVCITIVAMFCVYGHLYHVLYHYWSFNIETEFTNENRQAKYRLYMSLSHANTNLRS